MQRTLPAITHMSTTRLKIAKLAGTEDAAPIGRALESVPHVQSVSVDAEANQAVVEHDGADEEQLTAAVKGQGYVAIVE